MKTIQYEASNNILYNIYIGENDVDNWQMIDKAKQNDIWFHLKEFPSCHVILEVKNENTLEKLPKSLINYTACACKNNSKVSHLRNIYVIYTQIKNITKTTKIGSVYTKKTNEVKI
jgi:predicted ribosome quality control (RQC) complex YloA/Tae2 family protein